MKNILFPTDFSEAANRAFIYALDFAEKWGAEVTTLHVYSPIDVLEVYAPYEMAQLQDTIRQNQFNSYLEAVEALKKMAEEHGYGGIKIKHIMEEGPTVQSITSIAKKEKVDMIIMGTTGAHGLKELFLSSIAAEVLENAPCMTLAVPKMAEFDGKINHLAFTYSFKEEEKVALQRLIYLAEIFDAQIHVVNIDLAHTEFYLHRSDKLTQEFAKNERIDFTVLEGNDFFQVLTDFLEKRNIDILAMVTHQRNFLQELFHYSRAKMMSYHSKIPVLSIPAKVL